MKNLLVTGGAGFIGSNFIKYLLAKDIDCRIINLDALTYAGSIDNLSEVEKDSRYEFIQGSICERNLLDQIFRDYNIESVVHFAAESHVDNSISDPGVFVDTNIKGTFNLLETARKFWQIGPFKHKRGCEQNRFHHISTDEVYGSLGETGYFTEESPYAPNSPYSASKASSDLLVRSYFHTFGLNTLITNCSNNYGPFQHHEKLIPKIITNAMEGRPIPIYGDGRNVRDWLFVEDHCEAIHLVFKNGKFGEVYNVGGGEEKQNIQIAKLICSQLTRLFPDKGNFEDLITFVKDRHGHDRRYAVDCAKIKQNLGWRASMNFEEGLEKTIFWFLKKYYDKSF